MLDCIVNNPYRTLGVLSNSPLKERVANISHLKAFAQVGKEVNFPNDFVKILPSPPARTVEKIAVATNAINLDKDKLKHALFWFIKGNPMDEIALKHLQSGNSGKAREIFLKKETCSSLINVGVLSLAEDDINAGFENISKVIHSPELLKDLVRILDLANLSIAEDELALMFIEELLKEVPAKTLMRSAKRDADKTIFGKLALEKPIAAINSAIEIAKNVDSKDSEKNLAAGTELMESTKSPLREVKDIAGASSPQYQVVADNLAKQILQCGINYYNNAPESDVESPRKAMKLLSYALFIAVGEVAKQRCQQNYDILKEVVDGMPLAVVATEVYRIKDELKIFCQLPEKIVHSVEFLKKTKPILQILRTKLGASNSLYLRLSTQVISNALNNIIEEVNAALKYDPAAERARREKEMYGLFGQRTNNPFGTSYPSNFTDIYDRLYGLSQEEKDKIKKLEHMRDIAEKAWKAVLLTCNMDMDSVYRNEHYSPNVNTLKDICQRLGIDALTEEERLEKEQQTIRNEELRREKKLMDKKVRVKSNITLLITAIIFFSLVMIISVANGLEFWEGLVLVIWPAPPICAASGAIIYYGAKGLWKLLGFKGKFNSFIT